MSEIFITIALVCLVFSALWVLARRARRGCYHDSTSDKRIDDQPSAAQTRARVMRHLQEAIAEETLPVVYPHSFRVIGCPAVSTDPMSRGQFSDWFSKNHPRIRLLALYNKKGHEVVVDPEDHRHLQNMLLVKKYGLTSIVAYVDHQLVVLPEGEIKRLQAMKEPASLHTPVPSMDMPIRSVSSSGPSKDLAKVFKRVQLKLDVVDSNTWDCLTRSAPIQQRLDASLKQALRSMSDESLRAFSPEAGDTQARRMRKLELDRRSRKARRHARAERKAFEPIQNGCKDSILSKAERDSLMPQGWDANGSPT